MKKNYFLTNGSMEYIHLSDVCKLQGRIATEKMKKKGINIQKNAATNIKRDIFSS